MAATMASPSGTIRGAARRPALVSYLRNRRCVLFVGAGLSRPAGYPGWRQLMETVVQQTASAGVGDAGRVELSALLDAGRYAEVADQCRELLGRSRFGALLRAQLARPVAPPQATHRAIVQTPYAAIVTTNFDTLLEDAYGAWGQTGVPKAPTSAQLHRQGTLLLDRAFFILKAHGTIDDDSSLVFTSEDYRRIIHENPAFQSLMAAILLTHAVVFVGYSLNDPNFRLLLEGQLAVFGADAPPRYAVMEGVATLEAQILRRTAGIEVIPYPSGEHHHVAEFLAELSAAAKERSAARKRIAVLRDRHAVPALRVAIRPRDAMLDLEWFETTSDDLAGLAVPLERRSMTSTASLPWHELFESDAARRRTPHEIGALLARPFTQLGVPLLRQGKPRLVMLDVPHALAAVPWEWMVVDGRPLCLSTPVCRTISELSETARGRPFFHAPLRVLLIGDAIAETRFAHNGVPFKAWPLPGTREEVLRIAKAFRHASRRHQVTVLVGKDATFDRVLAELQQGYDIVHFAGVAYVDRDGESVVPLHDGYVRASELAMLLIQKPPGLLYVNEDCSGFVPAFGIDTGAPELAVRPQIGGAFDDLFHRMRQHRPGLERVVARAGVGTFIGCMGPSEQGPARDIAIEFYARVLAGEPFAQALFRARTTRGMRKQETALFFAMAGYADAQAIPTPAKRRS
jgi:hypothetical protein